MASLFDSDTYSGKPHALSRVIVPEPLALAWDAVRAPRGAAPAPRTERFDCVITSSPPESVHSVGRALQQRGVAWVAELRDAWTFEPLRPRFPTAAPAATRRAAGAPLLGAADAVVCV